MVIATHPCPCGYHGDKSDRCNCSAEQVQRYRGRISGPLLDRIDLFVDVARPKQVILPGNSQAGETSAAVRRRVVAAHRVQIRRQGVANSHLTAAGMKSHCRLDAEQQAFFEQAARQLKLSPRGCQRVLKVARTVADLDGAESIDQDHLAEAIGFRQPARR
ncbi:MAG: ATP-binding protein [Lysobacterales bacterium]